MEKQIVAIDQNFFTENLFPENLENAEKWATYFSELTGKVIAKIPENEINKIIFTQFLLAKKEKIAGILQKEFSGDGISAEIEFENSQKFDVAKIFENILKKINETGAEINSLNEKIKSISENLSPKILQLILAEILEENNLSPILPEKNLSAPPEKKEPEKKEPENENPDFLEIDDLKKMKDAAKKMPEKEILEILEKLQNENLLAENLAAVQILLAQILKRGSFLREKIVGENSELIKTPQSFKIKNEQIELQTAAILKILPEIFAAKKNEENLKKMKPTAIFDLILEDEVSALQIHLFFANLSDTEIAEIPTENLENILQMARENHSNRISVLTAKKIVLELFERNYFVKKNDEIEKMENSLKQGTKDASWQRNKNFYKFLENFFFAKK